MYARGYKGYKRLSLDVFCLNALHGNGLRGLTCVRYPVPCFCVRYSPYFPLFRFLLAQKGEIKKGKRKQGGFGLERLAEAITVGKVVKPSRELLVLLIQG